MKALTSSSSKFFSNKSGDGDKGFLCPRDDLISRSEIRFLRPPLKLVNLSFSSLLISLQHKTRHPEFSISSRSSSDTQKRIDNEEPHTEDINQPETVHVKFQLQRECSFGQQFLIVGEDPMLGLWDPSDAVPLNWSDGHVWTVELDIPTGKSIKFKFLLKGGIEDILWQPGPDRILQTRENEKTITVCEDWDNAELQKLIQEEPTSNQIKESTNNQETLIVAENSTRQTNDAIKESTNTNSITNPKETMLPFAQKPIAIVAENLTYPKEEKSPVKTNNMVPAARRLKEDTVSIPHNDMTTRSNILGNNGRAVNLKDLASREDEGDLVSSEGMPLLAPGLTPLPTVHTGEAFPNEVEKNMNNAGVGGDKAKDRNVPETDMETEEPQIEDMNQLKTVHVKFQLQRECSFGQQFLIVGDDPMLGLWDPSDAVPLNWSDGHVWTVEQDIPIGKSIKFKFLLKGGIEYILWQPGPDRILQTQESEKTITVCEDWDNAELQKIVQEEPTSDQIKESTNNQETLIVADNSTHQTNDVIKESTNTNSNTNPKETMLPFAQKPIAIFAENITYPKEEKSQVKTNNMVPGARRLKKDTVSISHNDMTTRSNILGNNGRAVNVKEFANREDEGNLVSYKGVPVLVSGLTPVLTVHTDEAFPNEVEKNMNNAGVGDDRAKDHNMPEIQLDLKVEPDKETPHLNDTTEMMSSDEQEPHQNEQVEKLQLAKERDQANTLPIDNGVLENDFQWGRRTMQKFISNWGIL